MEWSERYATGIAEIDKQHKMLFKMIHDFGIALDEGGGQRTYKLLLDSLREYAHAHFDLEEGCMHRYHCPAAEVNQRAHLGFIQYVGKYQDQYSASGFDRTVARDLMNALQSWLADHIGRIDTQLKGLVN